MNFYLLYGTDTSIIGREIDIIKEKLSISDNDVIYYNIEDIQNVVDEALTISMFSANKLIVIDSTIYLSQKKDIENINLLENYFNNYNSNSYLVFVSNSDTIDSRKKLVKFINSNGTTRKSTKAALPTSPWKWSSWRTACERWIRSLSSTGH